MEYSEIVKRWQEFERYLVETRYAVKDPQTGDPLEHNFAHMCKRFLGEIAGRIGEIEDVRRFSEMAGMEENNVIKVIFSMIEGRYIIPASPFLMSFGNIFTERKGYFSCYPLGLVEDSMDGIYEMCRKMKEIYIRGGGAGIDISGLRPFSSPVDSGQGIASGPVGFLPLFDAVTGTTNQGGRRRGALLVQMRWDHPDIRRFIKSKAMVPVLSQVVYSVPEEERSEMLIPLQNMNISVVVDGKFWERMEENDELLREIAYQMWRSGDPGLLFVENMVKYSPFNPGEYGEGHLPLYSNPCGEYLAPAGTACNLLTVNVAKIAYESKDRDEFLRKVAEVAYWACLLGNMILWFPEGYPLEEIRKKTQEVRPVGVGMTGFHTALLLMHNGNVRYGDEESVRFAEMVQAALTIGTLSLSADLAVATGKVYRWNEEYREMHMEELREVVDRGKMPVGEELEKVIQVGKEKGGFYNSVTTSQAPTGSVSQFARVAGDTGIEPLFEVVVKRRVRDISGGWKEVELVTEWLYPLLVDPDARKKVEEQVAYKLTPEEQIRMLEAFQRFVHTGISKTINVREETTVEEIIDLIKRSRDVRLKGFTLFRENCRVDTVYVSGRSRKEDGELPVVRNARVYEVKGTVNSYVTVSFDAEGRVREVFVNVGKAGTTLNSMFQAIGRVISVALRKDPGLVEKIADTLRGIESGEFYVCGELRSNSLPDMLAKILDDVRGKGSCNGDGCGEEGEEEVDGEVGDLCPNCFQLSVVRNGGCKTCRKCGYSMC